MYTHNTWSALKGVMKRALVLIGLVAISMHSLAEAVSLEEAESKARKFLTQQLMQGERQGVKARELTDPSRRAVYIKDGRKVVGQ